MPPVVVGGFLVLHGLITTMTGFSGVTKPDAPPLSLPSWFSWWPGPFGRSWLFDALHLGAGAAMVGGLIWLAAGVALIAGGLGWLGVPLLQDMRHALLVGGAGLGLVALVLYFHPIYVIAVAINLAIVALLWDRVLVSAS
jgi:hypothetical protein